MMSRGKQLASWIEWILRGKPTASGAIAAQDDFDGGNPPEVAE
jgi:hypothetical protein